MDVFSILSYINKVSLFAFFITTFVVTYQIYVIKKEKTKEKTPSIPDFKERKNFNIAINYTSLPNSVMKKEVKSVNYSKLIFVIISLLTIIVIMVVASLIKKNSNSQITITQTSNNSAPTPVLKASPTIIPMNIIPSSPIIPTAIITIIPSPTDTPKTPTIEPTEIILAKIPTITSSTDPITITTSTPQVLPETGSWEKGLLIIGVAISTIFFSFWF